MAVDVGNRIQRAGRSTRGVHCAASERAACGAVGVVPWVGAGEVLGVGVGSPERDRGLEIVGEIGVPCRPWADWVGDGPCVVAGEGCMADGSEGVVRPTPHPGVGLLGGWSGPCGP